MTEKKVLLEDLVFVGFNKRVLALDRYTGEVKWNWKSPKGSGFPAILVDGDRIIVSVLGYTYCLEPTTGSVVWENELTGFGTGTPNIASSHGNSSQQAAMAKIAADAAAAAAASTSHGAG